MEAAAGLRGELLRLLHTRISFSWYETVGRKSFPFIPSGFFCWSYNWIDIRQINSREKKLVSYVWELIQIRDSHK